MTDTGCLLNLGSRQRHVGDIITRKLNLVLGSSTALVTDSVQKLDATDTLLSKEITNLHILTSQGNVDGEMGVHESHLVEESLRDTDEHVLNVRANGTDASELLTGGEPKIDADALGLNTFLIGGSEDTQVHVNVLEVTGKFTTWSLDVDNAGLDGDFNCWREGEKEVGVSMGY